MAGGFPSLPSHLLLIIYMIKVVPIDRDESFPLALHLSTFPDRRVKHIQSICMKKKFACISRLPYLGSASQLSDFSWKLLASILSLEVAQYRNL